MAGLQQFDPEDVQAIQGAFQKPDDPINQQVIERYNGLTTPKYTNDGQLIAPTHAPITFETASKQEALGRGLAQGATVGTQSIGSGALEAGAGAVQSLATGENPFGDEGRLGGLLGLVKNYRRARDTQVQQNEAAQKSHPGIYIAGELVGGTPLAFATGGENVLGMGTVGSAIPATQRLLNTAQLAGAAGAISGFGNSKGDLTKGEIGKVADDTAKSALFAAHLGPVIAGVTSSLGGTDALEKAANARAFQSLGPTGKYAAQLVSEGKDQAIGRTLLDNDLIGPTSTRAKILSGVDSKLKEIGEKIGYFAKQADIAASRDSSIPQVSIPEFTENVVKQVVEPLQETNSQEPANAVLKWLEGLKTQHGNGELSFEKAQAMKGALDKLKAKFGSTGDSPARDAFQEVYGILRQHIDDGIENAFSKAAPELTNDFLPAKIAFSNLKDAQKILKTSVGTSANNASTGLREMMAGGIGGLVSSGADVSNLMKAGVVTAGMGAAHVGRKFGNQALAAAYDGLANLSEAPAGLLGELLKGQGPTIQNAASRTAAALKEVQGLAGSIQKTKSSNKEKP